MKRNNNSGAKTAPNPEPVKPDLKDWIDLVDVAEALHLSTRTLARWRNEHGLPYCKLGRKIYFHKSIVNDFLLARMQIPFANNGNNGNKPSGKG